MKFHILLGLFLLYFLGHIEGKTIAKKYVISAKDDDFPYGANIDDQDEDGAISFSEKPEETRKTTSENDPYSTDQEQTDFDQSNTFVEDKTEKNEAIDTNDQGFEIGHSSPTKKGTSIPPNDDKNDDQKTKDNRPFNVKTNRGRQPHRGDNEDENIPTSPDDSDENYDQGANSNYRPLPRDDDNNENANVNTNRDTIPHRGVSEDENIPTSPDDFDANHDQKPIRNYRPIRKDDDNIENNVNTNRDRKQHQGDSESLNIPTSPDDSDNNRDQKPIRNYRPLRKDDDYEENNRSRQPHRVSSNDENIPTSPDDSDENHDQRANHNYRPLSKDDGNMENVDVNTHRGRKPQRGESDDGNIPTPPDYDENHDYVANRYYRPLPKDDDNHENVNVNTNIDRIPHRGDSKDKNIPKSRNDSDENYDQGANPYYRPLPKDDDNEENNRGRQPHRVNSNDENIPTLPDDSEQNHDQGVNPNYRPIPKDDDNNENVNVNTNRYRKPRRGDSEYENIPTSPDDSDENRNQKPIRNYRPLRKDDDNEENNRGRQPHRVSSNDENIPTSPDDSDENHDQRANHNYRPLRKDNGNVENVDVNIQRGRKPQRGDSDDGNIPTSPDNSDKNHDQGANRYYRPLPKDDDNEENVSIKTNRGRQPHQGNYQYIENISTSPNDSIENHDQKAIHNVSPFDKDDRNKDIDNVKTNKAGQTHQVSKVDEDDENVIDTADDDSKNKKNINAYTVYNIKKNFIFNTIHKNSRPDSSEYSTSGQGQSENEDYYENPSSEETQLHSPSHGKIPNTEKPISFPDQKNNTFNTSYFNPNINENTPTRRINKPDTGGSTYYEEDSLSPKKDIRDDEPGHNEPGGTNIKRVPSPTSNKTDNDDNLYKNSNINKPLWSNNPTSTIGHNNNKVKSNDNENTPYWNVPGSKSSKDKSGSDKYPEIKQPNQGKQPSDHHMYWEILKDEHANELENSYEVNTYRPYTTERDQYDTENTREQNHHSNSKESDSLYRNGKPNNRVYYNHNKNPYERENTDSNPRDSGKSFSNNRPYYPDNDNYPSNQNDYKNTKSNNRESVNNNSKPYHRGKRNNQYESKNTRYEKDSNSKESDNSYSKNKPYHRDDNYNQNTRWHVGSDNDRNQRNNGKYYRQSNRPYNNNNYYSEHSNRFYKHKTQSSYKHDKNYKDNKTGFIQKVYKFFTNNKYEKEENFQSKTTNDKDRRYYDRKQVSRHRHGDRGFSKYTQNRKYKGNNHYDKYKHHNDRNSYSHRNNYNKDKGSYTQYNQHKSQDNKHHNNDYHYNNNYHHDDRGSSYNHKNHDNKDFIPCDDHGKPVRYHRNNGYSHRTRS